MITVAIPKTVADSATHNVVSSVPTKYSIHLKQFVFIVPSVSQHKRKPMYFKDSGRTPYLNIYMITRNNHFKLILDSKDTSLDWLCYCE